MRNLLFQFTVTFIAITICSTSGYPASGAFQVYPGGLSYPDGSVSTTAPKDGKTIISGSGAPIQGATLNDYYLDYTNHILYGPYNGSSWGIGTSLVGPQGPIGLQGDKGNPGIQGVAGANGMDGKTIYSGIGKPDDTLGVTGDFYLDTVEYLLYGPKDKTEGWKLNAASLKGPKGDIGQTGPQGNSIIRYQYNTDPEQQFVNKGKYVFRASSSQYLNQSIDIPKAVTDSYCGDTNGCNISLINIRNSDGWVAMSGTFKLFNNTTTYTWRSSVPSAGDDNNGISEPVLGQSYCELYDGIKFDRVSSDSSLGFSLYFSTGGGATVPSYDCELVIED